MYLPEEVLDAIDPDQISGWLVAGVSSGGEIVTYYTPSSTRAYLKGISMWLHGIKAVDYFWMPDVWDAVTDSMTPEYFDE